MGKLYEAKFKVPKDSEARIVKDLELHFLIEYSDKDTYLGNLGPKSLKLKYVDDRIIVYKMDIADGIFEIDTNDIDPSERDDLLSKHPIGSVLDRTKRVYFWNKFGLNCDFDYIKNFPNTLFLEVHSIDRKLVARGKDHLHRVGFKDLVEVPYNLFKE